jgi:hypothetical protein
LVDSTKEDGMTEVERLEHASVIADARLGVAEELSWFIAFLGAVVVHMKESNWFFTMPAFIALYMFFTHTYKKKAKKAEDDWYRAGKFGKYMVPYEPSDSRTSD